MGKAPTFLKFAFDVSILTCARTTPAPGASPLSIDAPPATPGAPVSSMSSSCPPARGGMVFQGSSAGRRFWWLGCNGESGADGVSLPSFVRVWDPDMGARDGVCVCGQEGDRGRGGSMHRPSAVWFVGGTLHGTTSLRVGAGKALSIGLSLSEQGLEDVSLLVGRDPPGLGPGLQLAIR